MSLLTLGVGRGKLSVAAGGGNPVALRGTPTSTFEDEGASPLTVTKPTGVVAGDYILIAFMIQEQAANVTVTGPSGFTLIHDHNVTGGGGGSVFQSFVWAKIAGASEPSTYDITWSAGSHWTIGAVIAFQSVSGTQPSDSVEGIGENVGSPAAVSNSGVTVAEADDAVVNFAFVVSNNTGTTTWTVPSGFTNQITQRGVSLNKQNLFIDTLLNASAGATGTISGTGTKASDAVSFHAVAVAIAKG